MIPLDKLLKPLSDDAPSGPSLEESLELANRWNAIEVEARGKPEQAFGGTVIPAKEGDWRVIGKECVELLQECRHVGPLVYLVAAEVRLSQWQGLAQGLELLARTLAEHWDSLHPQADADDPDDPFWERQPLLDLMSLGHKESTDDPLKLIEAVRALPLAESREVGRFSHDDYLKARQGNAGVTVEMIQAALEKSDPEHVERMNTSLQAGLKSIDEAEAVFAKQCTGPTRPSLRKLRAELADIQAAVAQLSGVATAAEAEGLGAASVAGIAGAAPTAGGVAVQVVTVGSGVLGSRQDAIAYLDAVIHYFRMNEPSNPIPYLLERSKQLVDKNFLEIIRNLRSDLEKDFKAVFGDVSEGGTMAPPPPRAPSPAPTAPAAAPKPPAKPDWSNASF